MTEPAKISFHVPASDRHLVDLIQLICDVKGTTTSAWVYDLVLNRLKTSGLIDSNNQIVKSAYETLQRGLPDAQPKKKEAPHGKH